MCSATSRLTWVWILLLVGAAPSQGQERLGVDELVLIGEPKGAPVRGVELEEQTEAIARSMRCPVCQGLSVADSPTASALAMKNEIRNLLAAGYTRKQILDYFEAAYGEFIRLQPKPEGFNLLVWIVPALALGVGVALVVLRMRSGDQGRVRKEGLPEDPELESYRERVRREVAS